MDERRTNFWDWLGENPITAIAISLVLMGAVAIVCGYRDGITAIVSGLLGWLKTDDSENKRRLEETRRTADIEFHKVKQMTTDIKQQQIINDEEVNQVVENAKAECEEMDIDELIDIGNSMLRDHGAFRGETD